MKKCLKNTYFNIFLFFVSNLITSFSLRVANINEIVLILIDFMLCLTILYIISYYSEIKNKKSLFKELILICFSGSFFLAIFNYCYFEFFNQNEISKMLNDTKNQLSKEGYSSNQIKKAMEISVMLASPVAIAFLSFLGYCFSGLISSLICLNLFAKKNGK